MTGYLPLKTIRVPEELVGELLRAFIGDPLELCSPRPVGERGYWGDANDSGIEMTTDDSDVVGFIEWPDLLEYVDALRAYRAHSALNVTLKVRPRVRRTLEKKS